jgi:hypothetical protein
MSFAAKTSTLASFLAAALVCGGPTKQARQNKTAYSEAMICAEPVQKSSF